MVSAAERKHEQIIAQLSQEYLADAGERLGMIEEALGSDGIPHPDALTTLRREAHNLKGMASDFHSSA